MVDRPILHMYNTMRASSARWGQFTQRPGDIFVCTPPKVGTTWTQGIVRSLVSGYDEPEGIIPLDAPWLDSRMEPIEKMVERLEAQQHRRCIKTHTPADGIPLFADAHYIVVYRNGLDSFMSEANHERGRRQTEGRNAVIEDAIADGVDLSAMPQRTDDIHELFARWIADPPQLEHFDTWWPLRTESNVTVLHYDDLWTDLEGEMRRLAQILDIEVPDDAWPRVVERCSLDEMREAHRGDPFIDRQFDHGADRFFHKGGGGRWRDVLSDDDVTQWQRVLFQRLGKPEADWFERGSLAVGTRAEDL